MARAGLHKAYFLSNLQPEPERYKQPLKPTFLFVNLYLAVLGFVNRAELKHLLALSAKERNLVVDGI
jgi:hypothetical protein